MSKSFFIDTTLCTACRACQVACKQWHDLPAEETVNRGTFENPPDLSFSTYKLVRMREVETKGRLQWLFFAEQCRHCLEPPCRDTAGEPTAIFSDDATGAVLFTANTKLINGEEIIAACPYNIPRKGPDGTLAKCDMCIDRVQNGLKPACVKTCPTGTMNFGDREEIVAMAEKRLAEVRGAHPKASLIDADDVAVIYLVTDDPAQYFEHAVASRASSGMTRNMALREMLRPLRRMVAPFA